MNSLKDLILFLDKWYANRANSVQLDGNHQYHNNPSECYLFRFKGRNYRLAGDTKDFAVKRFLDLVKMAADPESVLIEATGRTGNPVLRLAGQSKAEGWYCTGT